MMSSDPESRVGKSWGRLTTVGQVYKGGRLVWECRCSCGCATYAAYHSLSSGNTKSCGCLKKERAREQAVKKVVHGLSGTRIYACHRNMIDRCFNPSNKRWKNYGGRGITVEDYLLSLGNFSAYMGEAPEGHTLDRIDVNLGYTRGNLRWVDTKTQSLNKTTTLKVGAVGESAADVAKRLGIPYTRLLYWVNRGVKAEDVPLIPRGTKSVIYYGGRPTSLLELCAQRGLIYSTVWARIHRRGVSLEKAIGDIT